MSGLANRREAIKPGQWEGENDDKQQGPGTPMSAGPISNEPPALREASTALLRALTEGMGLPIPVSIRWLAAGSVNLMTAWRDLRGTAPQLHFVEDPGFRTAFDRLDGHMAEYAALAHELIRPEGANRVSERFAEILQGVERSAYQLASAVAGEERVLEARRKRRRLNPGADWVTSSASLEEMAIAYVRNQALEVASVALALFINLVPSEKEEVPGMSGAERVRLKRERERRGIRHRIPVNVYDGDLTLLRAFGYLSPPDMGDRSAIARALEAFLASGYMARPSAAVSWEERYAAQTARLNDVHGINQSSDKDEQSS